MITDRRKSTTEITFYGMSSFQFYRWNQFKVIPLTRTLRTRSLPQIVCDVRRPTPVHEWHDTTTNSKWCNFARFDPNTVLWRFHTVKPSSFLNNSAVALTSKGHWHSGAIWDVVLTCVFSETCCYRALTRPAYVEHVQFSKDSSTHSRLSCAVVFVHCVRCVAQ